MYISRYILACNHIEWPNEARGNKLQLAITLLFSMAAAAAAAEQVAMGLDPCVTRQVLWVRRKKRSWGQEGIITIEYLQV